MRLYGCGQFADRCIGQGSSPPYIDQAKRMVAFRYDIQSILGVFLNTAGGADFGWPTMIGATGAYPSGSFIAEFPFRVPSQPCAKPIQHVPIPAACAASIKFSAAKEQSSTAHGPLGAEITISVGAP